MTNETKTALMNDLDVYMKQHGLSQNEAIKASGVNSAYFGAMRKCEFALQIGGKEITIADRYFKKIAEYIGIDPEKEYWKTKNTPQLLRTISELSEAKKLGETTVIIGQTGAGKTYAVQRFQRKFPKDVFHIILSRTDTIRSIVDKIFISLNKPKYNKGLPAQVREIIRILKELELDGMEPQIVFDESEYMKEAALCAMKELHDALDGHCSVVIIGTAQLITSIDRMVKCNRKGIPQFFRRIKFRIRHLPSIDRNFNEFLNGRFDKEVERWLQRNCDNYGELHDVLLPALREADRLGKTVDLDFIKMVLGID